MNDASTTLRQRKYWVDRAGTLTGVSLAELTPAEHLAILKAWRLDARRAEADELEAAYSEEVAHAE